MGVQLTRVLGAGTACTEGPPYQERKRKADALGCGPGVFGELCKVCTACPFSLRMRGRALHWPCQPDARLIVPTLL